VIGSVVVALGVDGLVSRRRPHWSPWSGLGVAVVLVAPFQGCAALFVGFATHRFRTASKRTRLRRQEKDACFEATELVALGLAGGLSIGAAHELALAHVAPAGGAALSALVHEIQTGGTRVALLDDKGPMSHGSRVLAAAVDSGAAALPALSAFLETEAHRRHSERVEAIRRLPVRLLLPLTLLVLPGFVLMTVGPTVIESLARLNP
jgi:hypothetical protein